MRFSLACMRGVYHRHVLTHWPSRRPFRRLSWELRLARGRSEYEAVVTGSVVDGTRLTPRPPGFTCVGTPVGLSEFDRWSESRLATARSPSSGLGSLATTVRRCFQECSCLMDTATLGDLTTSLRLVLQRPISCPSAFCPVRLRGLVHCLPLRSPSRYSSIAEVRGVERACHPSW